MGNHGTPPATPLAQPTEMCTLRTYDIKVKLPGRREPEVTRLVRDYGSYKDLV